MVLGCFYSHLGADKCLDTSRYPSLLILMTSLQMGGMKIV
ncbi:hypothetical protein HMPREF9176_2258 [Streptococcus downei F0415]|nr:hypothetical protein HMPREF9176_2258 [Streptococcus downei F0415]